MVSAFLCVTFLILNICSLFDAKTEKRLLLNDPDALLHRMEMLEAKVQDLTRQLNEEKIHSQGNHYLLLFIICYKRRITSLIIVFISRLQISNTSNVPALKIFYVSMAINKQILFCSLDIFYEYLREMTDLGPLQCKSDIIIITKRHSS